MAESVLRSSILFALVMVPLCLDKSAAQVFEAPKASLLHAIAVLVLLACAVAALARGASQANAAPARAFKPAELARVPAIAAGLGVLLATCLSTALSLSPRESFFGHLGRGGGISTLLAQMTLSAVVLRTAGSRTGRRALVTALLIPSIPLGIYSIAQRLGLQALPVTAHIELGARAESLFGQPVFAAAYFILVLPFAVLRAWESFRVAEDTPSRRWLSTGLYASVALLQLAGLLLSESRGAILASLVSGGVALLIVASRRRSRRITSSVWALILFGALCVALGVPKRLASFAGSAEMARIAQRASNAFTLQSGGGDFRKGVWMIAERALREPKPFEFADGHHDSLAAVRSAIGYGPETQYAFAPLSYRHEYPMVADYGLVDRFHNQLWDDLLTTGGLGLLAWLVLQLMIVSAALRGLGALSGPNSVRRFVGFYGIGALLGALTASVLHGPPLAFLGLQLGAVAGVAIFVSIGAWRSPDETPAKTGPHRAQTVDDPERQALLLAALSAIIAHLLEVSFSFRLVTTGMLLWILGALVVVCSDVRLRSEAPEAATTSVARETLADATLLACALFALGFAFISANRLSSSVGTLLWDALTLLNQPPGVRKPLVAVLIGATALGGGLLLVQNRAATDAQSRKPFLPTAGVACALALVVSCWFAAIFSELAPPRDPLFTVLDDLAVRAHALTVYYVAGGAALLLHAWACMPRQAQAKRPASTARLWALVLGSLVSASLALATIDWLCLRPQRADIAFAIARQLEAQKRFGEAVQLHQQAVAIAPTLGVYQANFGKFALARADADPSGAAHWREQAEQSLRAAIASNPIATENVINLAHVFAQRVVEGPADERVNALPEVQALHERGLRLHPFSPAMWRFWAQAQLTLLSDPEGALASAQHAVMLDERAAANYALLAACHMALANAMTAARRREAKLSAAMAYERAGTLARNRASYFISAGSLYRELGFLTEAATALRTALAQLEPGAPQRVQVAERLEQVQAQLALADKRNDDRH